jgi:threonine/homoserine/homoserine lactone efflux protein
MGEILPHVLAVLPAFLLAAVAGNEIGVLARNWLSRAAIRRRLERILGATLVALGIDLAAASR